MTDSDRERDAAEPASLEDELERTLKLILERRNRFMAAALAGIGMAASGAACTRATVCLSPLIPSGGAGGSGGTTANEPCPGRPGKQPPCVCLSISPVAGQPGPYAGNIAQPVGGMVAPPVAGMVATPNAGHAANGGSGGTSGAAGKRPSVCLSPPIDDNDAGTK